MSEVFEIWANGETSISLTQKHQKAAPFGVNIQGMTGILQRLFHFHQFRYCCFCSYNNIFYTPDMFVRVDKTNFG